MLVHTHPLIHSSRSCGKWVTAPPLLFFFKIEQKFVFLCTCVCMHMYAQVLGAGVKGGGELPDMGARNELGSSAREASILNC